MEIRTGRNLQITSFLFIMLFLMSCCGRSGEMSDEMWWYERIESWQTRELSCLNYPEYNYSTPDFIIDPLVLKNVSMEVSHDFKYFTDRESDYWQTSCETIQNGKGDCEDLAILLWNKLRMRGFPDEKIGMLLSEKDGLFHVCVIAYYSEDDFYIIDPTGYFTWDTVQSSEFFANKKIRLILWFNLFSIQEF